MLRGTVERHQISMTQTNDGGMACAIRRAGSSAKARGVIGLTLTDLPMRLVGRMPGFRP
jgi:hypothetical protein